MKRALGERAARLRASMGGGGVSDGPSTKERMALTVPEVAEQLGLHQNTVYRLLQSGELPGRRLGRRSWRVSAAGLEKWLRGRYGQAQDAGRGFDLPDDQEASGRPDPRPLAGAVERRRADGSPPADPHVPDSRGDRRRTSRAPGRRHAPVGEDLGWRLPRALGS